MNLKKINIGDPSYSIRYYVQKHTSVYAYVYFTFTKMYIVRGVIWGGLGGRPPRKKKKEKKKKRKKEKKRKKKKKERRELWITSNYYI